MADYATLLRDHVTLKVRSIDRIFLQAYVPKLQSVGQVCRFLRWQKGYPIPSSAAFGKIGEGYVKAVEAFAKRNGTPIVHFKKGENKEERVRPLLASGSARWRRASGADRRCAGEGLCLAFLEGEGTGAGGAPPHGVGSADGVHQSLLLLPLDPEWGLTFWKTNAYAPFPIWLWLNGHEWAKRQMEKVGIAYEALDNGFLSCADPETLQRRCDELGSDDVQDFFQRWSSRLPSPFTKADLAAGYGYDLAFRQFEVSETSIFDRPQAGRAWFEGVIRDHLDISRPDQWP